MPVGPTGQYRLFVEKCSELRLDLSCLHVFNMDEYVGDDGCNLPESHPLSFIGFRRRHFYSPMAPECHLNPQQMHIPDARYTAAYSRTIEGVGGIDICFGGIGINGHIAFNEALDYWELMSNEAFKQLPAGMIRPPSEASRPSLTGPAGRLSSRPWPNPSSAGFPSRTTFAGSRSAPPALPPPLARPASGS